MKIIETTEGVGGTRSLIAWSYRNLASEKELKNVMADKTISDVFDVIPYVENNSTRVAFQIGNEGIFQDYKESWRYTCSKDLFDKFVKENPIKKPSIWKSVMNWSMRNGLS